MIPRRKTEIVLARLSQFPAVALLGPRQAGKTTLAEQIAAGQPSVYLDLESPADREKLADAELYLSGHEDKLVILDEVQRAPHLFQTLRGLIDKGRRRGRTAGRFLLLGSASIDLLRQSGETLAGRIAYVELGPFNALEIDGEAHEKLWIRGGFPDSFLASTDPASAIWRENFIRTYLERDIPQLGPRVPAERSGFVCLNRFSRPISGLAAGKRLRCRVFHGAAAGPSEAGDERRGGKPVLHAQAAC